MRRLLSLLLLFFSLLQAEEMDVQLEEAFSSSLTNTESLVSTLIDGSISAITGEWVDTQVDFVLQGPESLEFRRLYSSRHHWYFNRPCDLHLTEGLRNLEQTAWQASFKHPSGAITSHLALKPAEKPGKESFYLKLHHRRGLTNCGSSEISARTNLNNTQVLLDPVDHVCQVQLGNGDVIQLKKSGNVKEGDKKVFHVDVEKKASGNISSFTSSHIYCFQLKAGILSNS